MIVLKKGDVVLVSGKIAYLDCNPYEKWVHDYYGHEIVRKEKEIRASFQCVNVVFPDTGIKWTVKTSDLERVGREFP